MLVLTHPDKIRATISQSVIETYAMEHPDDFIQVEFDIPPEDQPLIRSTIATRHSEEIKQKKDMIFSELFGTQNELGIDSDSDCYIVNGRFLRGIPTSLIIPSSLKVSYDNHRSSEPL
jgi:hypothetical protein